MLAGALLAVVALLMLRPNDIAQPADILVGKPAPHLPETLRGRVVVVNFFASWCLPCKAEHPLLKKLAQNSGAVVGIAFKDSGTAQYLAENGNPYKLVIADRDGRIARAYGVAGVPDSFIIDKSGTIRLRIAGPLTETTLQKDVMPLLEKLQKN
jgi:cytochrome c biogenesis protein CcmG/thiol:disulfide interchange protein DsbE